MSSFRNLDDVNLFEAFMPRPAPKTLPKAAKPLKQARIAGKAWFRSEPHPTWTGGSWVREQAMDEPEGLDLTSINLWMEALWP